MTPPAPPDAHIPSSTPAPAAPRPAFVFAGGGTGGHIVPALAIIERLRARAPDATFHILCSQRPVDARVLAPSGVPFTPTPAAPPGLHPRALLRFLTGWRGAARITRRLIRQLRAEACAPIHLIAMGGFVAPAPAAAARALGARTLLVNLDAVPGKANRYLARRVDRVVTALPAPGFGFELVGPIVRAALRPSLGLPPDSAAARARLGLDPALRTLVITGGSQGAQTVGRLALDAARARPAAFQGWQVLHQAVAPDVQPAVRAWAEFGIPARVETFIADMPSAWHASDLHLGRCGAGTVAEAWATGTPSVFLPYPWHADDHQRANAEGLRAAGAALVWTDHIDADTNARAHAAALADLLADAPRPASALSAMRAAAAALGHADGAQRLADLLLAPT